MRDEYSRRSLKTMRFIADTFEFAGYSYLEDHRGPPGIRTLEAASELYMFLEMAVEGREIKETIHDYPMDDRLKRRFMRAGSSHASQIMKMLASNEPLEDSGMEESTKGRSESI